jgi:pantoate kinase
VKKRCGSIAMVTIASPLPPGPGLALAGKADLGAVLDTLGQLELDRLAVASVTRCGASVAASVNGTVRR